MAMSRFSNDPTHNLIPGGAHTYSKGDDQFPANAPRFIERGEGAVVWDRDGRRFLDWTMGLRTMTLGYGNETVNQAAIDQIHKGSNFGRPSHVETELAEELTEAIPGAEMFKFAKNGSTATTAAVKLARAHTGRDLVAFCKDHPFFSYDDWFIGTTECNAGVPKAIAELSLPFHYNDLDSVQAIFDAHPDGIAALIMEAATDTEPVPGFLEGVQDLCRRHGTVFIIDEMITGFRWDVPGAQSYFGIKPDLSTFGKGIANGFSLSVLAGRREIMELGGLNHDKARVFLISTTHGAENHAIAAACAAVKFVRENDVVPHLWRIGQRLIDGLNAAARTAGVSEQVVASGYACSPVVSFRNREGEISLPLRTLFLQEMVKAGVFINNFTPSFAHTEADVDFTVEAAEGAFKIYASALDGDWESFLEGPAVKPVFREFN